MYLRAVLPLLVLVACGGSELESAVPDADDSDWVALETGAGCAPAEVACGPGNCAANVANGCQKPVTCDLFIECICRSTTGEEGPATATSGENTILSGNRQGLAAKVICDQGDVIATIARRVDCY
jgi:hypothetical protein